MIWDFFKRKDKEKDEDVTIKFADIKKSVGTISSSAEAVERVIQLFKMHNTQIIRKVKVDAGTWNCYILYTPNGNYIVKFSSAWLWNFSKIYNRPETQGAGLNFHLAKYCQSNGINTLLIVREDGIIYSCSINSFVDFVVTHNTIREEKGNFEAHIPTTLLKIFSVGMMDGTQ